MADQVLPPIDTGTAPTALTSSVPAGERGIAALGSSASRLLRACFGQRFSFALCARFGQHPDTVTAERRRATFWPRIVTPSAVGKRLGKTRSRRGPGRRALAARLGRRSATAALRFTFAFGCN